MSIRVLLVDDHALARTGFRMVLDTEPDMEVVGEAATGRQAIHSAHRRRPDVVLMDVRMPELDGIAATREIAGDRVSAPRVLILTTFDLDEYVYDALRAGASGFLLKDVTAERLFDAVRVIAAGEALLAPAVTRRLISEFALRPEPSAPATAGLAALTPRETQVLRLVAEGLTDEGIAQQLVLSPHTVHRHVSNIRLKLDAPSRAAAAAAAARQGLI